MRRQRQADGGGRNLLQGRQDLVGDVAAGDGVDDPADHVRHGQLRQGGDDQEGVGQHGLPTVARQVLQGAGGSILSSSSVVLDCRPCAGSCQFAYWVHSLVGSQCASSSGYAEPSCVRAGGPPRSVRSAPRRCARARPRSRRPSVSRSRRVAGRCRVRPALRPFSVSWISRTRRSSGVSRRSSSPACTRFSTCWLAAALEISNRSLISEMPHCPWKCSCMRMLNCGMESPIDLA